MAKRLIEQIPIIGHDIYQVGQVVELLSSPCEPEPTIAVRAFFANVPMLVWSLVKPEPVDYLTERFGSPHKKRRRRRFLANAIDVDPTGKKTGLRWASFKSVRFLERIGWYFLVVDATTDFVINWTSMAYLYSGCPVPSTGYASWWRDDADIWFSTGDDTEVGGTHFQSSGPFNANTSTLQNLLPGPCFVNFSADIAKVDASPQGQIDRLYVERVQGSIHTNYEAEISGEFPTGSRFSSAIVTDYNTFEQPSIWNIRAEASGGWVALVNTRASLSGFPTEGIAPDP